ncbi:MAG: N-acetylmuramoyl-L-alanine amidase-like domain-containing protein [Prolixibacteraceae bacterium]
MAFKSGILLLLFVLAVNFSRAQAKVNLNDCIFKPEDQQIAHEKLSLFAADKNLPIADLLVKIGLSFLGTPYVGATLENGPEEKMVVNLRELDCTTFAENCLAFARTIKSGKTDFESFVAELKYIRYRDGICDKYPSRLHYFSEWIHNNATKRTISEMPNLNGVKISKTITFMSQHPESYPVLSSNPEMIPIIAQQEKKLSEKPFYYFPKTNPENLLKNLKHGDIIGLTASEDATVDVNHVGIIVKKGNVLHVLHASLSGKMVILSDGPVTDFIKPESINGGIVIARPVY